MFKHKFNIISKEIISVLSKVNEREITNAISKILKAKKIVVIGAGRVGFAAKGFAMRLGHLGLEAYFIGDSTVPAIGRGDLLLVCSGSGETQTIYDLALISKNNKAAILLVTGNPLSRIGKLADYIIKIEAPSKTKAVEGFASLQPMTTLNEQCLGLLFDGIVLMLMDKINETHESMWKRHSNLE